MKSFTKDHPLPNKVVEWLRLKSSALLAVLQKSDGDEADTTQRTELPPVSGRRGARLFLFQTLRGRKILQNSNDSDASDDNRTLQALIDRRKLLAEAAVKDDLHVFFSADVFVLKLHASDFCLRVLCELEDFIRAEQEDTKPLKKPDRSKPIG